MRNMLIVAGGVVAVAAIAVAVYSGTRPAAPPAGAPVASAPGGAAASLSVQATDQVLGDPKAAVTIVEYASLTCSHCASFHNQVLPDIKKKWIDTGKVKLVYRDFPLDRVALQAAQIAECSGKERYFAVLDIMFRGQAQWAVAQDAIGELSKSLRVAGIGDAEIKACLANDAIQTAVVAEGRAGEALGVSATPTIFINGERYSGPRSIEAIDTAIAKHVK